MDYHGAKRKLEKSVKRYKRLEKAGSLSGVQRERYVKQRAVLTQEEDREDAEWAERLAKYGRAPCDQSAWALCDVPLKPGLDDRLRTLLQNYIYRRLVEADRQDYMDVADFLFSLAAKIRNEVEEV